MRIEAIPAGISGRVFLLPKIYLIDTGDQFSENPYIDKEDMKMNASVAIQSLPEAANDEELIRIVDEVIAYIKSTGLNYYVGPFETAIDGYYKGMPAYCNPCRRPIRCGLHQGHL